MPYLVSVVIPVYNVAPYLRECLDSVMAQTYTNWEAICVDDGSTDDSGAILDEYAARDSRFYVIHQANAGVSAARNVALDVARGEWVMFLDSDDLLHHCALDILIHNNMDDIDIVLMEHIEINSATEFSFEYANVARNEMVINSIEWNIYFHPIYAAIYRRSRVEGLRFEMLTIGEDRVWFLEALDNAKKISLVNFIGYGYRNRVGSAMRSEMTKRKFMDELLHQVKICEIVNRRPYFYSPTVRRRLGQSLTEYTSALYSLIPVTDRELCHNFWIGELKKVSEYVWLTLFQRIGIRLCIIFKSRVVTFMIYYIPYWIKSHGVHR